MVLSMKLVVTATTISVLGTKSNAAVAAMVAERMSPVYSL